MGVRADSVSVGLHPTTEFFQRMSKYLEIKWVTLLFQPEKWVVSLNVQQVMPNAMTAHFRIESWIKFHKIPSLFHYDHLFAVISAGPSACVWFGTEGAVNALMVSPMAPWALWAQAGRLQWQRETSSVSVGEKLKSQKIWMQRAVSSVVPFFSNFQEPPRLGAWVIFPLGFWERGPCALLQTNFSR